MKMRRIPSFVHDNGGAVLIEYTLVFVMLMVMTFGLIEFGIVFYQYNTAEAATAVGARYIATRGPVYTGLADCGVATSANAGTLCSSVSGSDTWTVTCNATSPAAGCQSTVLNALVARMQQFQPAIQAQNVQVVLKGSGLGFVGRGSPVPLVTVRLTGMTYNFIVLDDLLGFSPLTMPSFDATLVAEDFNGAGS
jgi:Flp pilus assembly protein TadG